MTGGVWEGGYFTLINRTLLLSAAHHSSTFIHFKGFLIDPQVNLYIGTIKG